MFDFSEVVLNLDLLLRGLWLTLLLWFLSFGLGLVAGLPIGLARGSPMKGLNWPATGWIEIFRNTPVLIQLVWFYYAFPVLTGLQMSAFTAAALGLTLNTSAYCAEIWRGGIQSLPRGQWEAARAIGMGGSLALRRIILPQALRRMVPAFTNRAIEVGKMTAIASVLSVQDLMYEARLLSANIYRPLEVFTVIALVYFIVIYPITLLSYRLEARLRARG